MLGKSRLVTLVGGPGVGKSRLALEAAAAVTGDYVDGVWLVPLESITDPARVAEAVAATLGIAGCPGMGFSDTLVAELAHKRLLLVLDNCEHLIEACAPQVQRLLESCDSLVVLVVSREPLCLRGERIRRIGPLELPPENTHSPEVLVAYDAARLFVERAVTACDEFGLDARSAPLVADICRRLDGIPLAIELAAARLQMFSLEEIRRGLDDRFRLLTSETRVVRAHHKTLLAAIDLSYELLEPLEAAMLRRLSVFVGGFTASAAEEVCEDHTFTAETVMQLLGALVRKSLVWVDTRHGETRYRLSENIRDYADRRMEEASEKADLRTRHCRWCVVLAERAESELAGVDCSEWLEKVTVEQDNLQAGFEWAMSTNQTELVLRLSGALATFWFLRCDGEGRRWLTSALGVGGCGASDSRAKALWGAALLAESAGDVDQAITLARQCHAMAMECDDTALRRRVRHLLGMLSLYESPLDARALLQTNVALARQEGGSSFLASSLATLGSACILLGDGRNARNHLKECLDLSRRDGARLMEAGALTGLGHAALAEGDYGAAESLLQDARCVAREEGGLDEEAVALGWLGELARGQGRYRLASAFLDEGLAIARMLDLPILAARCQCFKGRAALAAGDLDHAREQLGSAFAFAERAGLSYLLARCLLGLAEASALEGDWSTARAMTDEAVAVARAYGDRQAVAAGWYALAGVARWQGSLERSDALCQRAITLQNDIGDLPGLVSSLEMSAALHGPGPGAVRLFAAAQAARERSGYARPAVVAEAYDADLRDVGKSLTSDEFSEAWMKGSSLSLQEAIASHVGRQRSGFDGHGGGIGLTPAELGVARLAAKGLTNREIGLYLFMSPRTAGAHLTRVFAKLGIHSRSELRRLALSDLELGLDPPELIAGNLLNSGASSYHHS